MFVQIMCWRNSIADTLPYPNASINVLQKVGMKFVGDMIDPEDGPVWRWRFE